MSVALVLISMHNFFVVTQSETSILKDIEEDIKAVVDAINKQPIEDENGFHPSQCTDIAQFLLESITECLSEDIEFINELEQLELQIEENKDESADEEGIAPSDPALLEFCEELKRIARMDLLHGIPCDAKTTTNQCPILKQKCKYSSTHSL